MSEWCGSISGDPCVIHSAIMRPTPGPSLIHTAAADQRLRTSAVSPSSGKPSGVSDSSPLIAYFISAVARMSGISSSASSSCWSKSSAVNGSSVGDRRDSLIDGMSSAWWKIGRWAYEPTSIEPPVWRS